MPHNEMMECIEACTYCHAVCLHTLEHCLNKGGKHADPAHIRHLIDCSQICATSADFMNRGSHLHTETCRACAAICEHCAHSCEKMNDDAHMQRCIDACRKCAAKCQEMSGAAA
ncbi:MAG: four-helix bundle copper-binding protein [Phycisphaerae bacterium]